MFKSPPARCCGLFWHGSKTWVSLFLPGLPCLCLPLLSHILILPSVALLTWLMQLRLSLFSLHKINSWTPHALYLILLGRMHVIEFRISANDVTVVTESDGAEIV